MTATTVDPRQALDDLRAARRRTRMGEIHWIDALYKAYLTAFLAGIAVLALSGAVGDAELTPAQVDDVRAHGAAVLGVGLAVLIAGMLRAGSRGGPLALEAPDVRHVLLSPVPRVIALRPAAVRQVRHAGFIGLVVGAIAGQLAARRLPGDTIAWVMSGGAAGALGAAAAYGAGFLASGLRWSRWSALGVGIALIGWAGADLLDAVPGPAPTSVLGALALWPVELAWWALAGAAGAVALGAAGLRYVGGVSLEAAERRTSLVGQLRFAATLQDLRTVMVLRRQLAQEHPRRSPWLGWVPGGRGRFAVWERDWRGVARWPAVRFVRIAVLGGVAGASLVGVANGTTPLLIVAGLAVFVAGLDAVEGLAQEVDHPTVAESLPVARGRIHLLHLPMGMFVLGIAGLAGLAVAMALEPSTDTLSVGVVVIVSAAVCGAAAAGLSTVSGPIEQTGAWSMVPPEVSGMRNVVRLVFPPAVAVLGVLPVLPAVRGPEAASPVANAAVAAVAAVLIGALVMAWISARDAVLGQMREAMEQMGDGARPTDAARAAAAGTEPEGRRRSSASQAPDSPGDDTVVISERRPVPPARQRKKKRVQP
ncbi:MAG TPA: hypothetical protein VK866_00580 [Acidimicrobiales bacterium]|nr:hypothetical protein [Acidimicrobiales bacterium]